MMLFTTGEGKELKLFKKFYQEHQKELQYEREPQGEAIAWSRSGEEFYTLSESRHGKRTSLMMHSMKIY